MTKEEAGRQLDAMLLIEEPWTPGQWERAMELSRIHAPRRFCFGKSWSRDRMFYEFSLHQLRQSQAFAASIEAMPAMSLADFKRELSQ